MYLTQFLAKNVFFYFNLTQDKALPSPYTRK